VVPLLPGGRFAQMGVLLPGLLRDADALVGCSADGTLTKARRQRGQVRQVAGSLMSHTWQFDVAGRAFALAMTDADDALAVMSAAEEKSWGLLRQGRLAET